MKKFNIILIIALLLPIGLSAKKVYEAEKVVNHSFPASSSHTLAVENTFGSISIELWDKNEVSADIIITGKSSRSQELANDLVGKTAVDVAVNGNTISFKTETGSVKSSRSSNNVSQVDYVIKVPRSISFDLKNKFGNIYVDECSNQTKIDIQFGNFSCVKMKSAATLRLEYGDATIQEAAQLKAKVSYSTLNLSSIQALDLSSAYSKFKIGKVSTINASSSAFDDFKIEEINNLKIEAKYTPIKIDKVTGDLSIVSKFGDVVISNASSSSKSFYFNLDYGDLKININPQIGYQLDVSCKYGKLSMPEDVPINIEHREVAKNTTTIKGNIGKGTPNLKINATSSFADIKISAK